MIQAEAKAWAIRTAMALTRALITFGGAVLIDGLTVWTVTRAGGLFAKPAQKPAALKLNSLTHPSKLE